MCLCKDKYFIQAVTDFDFYDAHGCICFKRSYGAASRMGMRSVELSHVIQPYWIFALPHLLPTCAKKNLKVPAGLVDPAGTHKISHWLCFTGL